MPQIVCNGCQCLLFRLFNAPEFVKGFHINIVFNAISQDLFEGWGVQRVKFSTVTNKSGTMLALFGFPGCLSCGWVIMVDSKYIMRDLLYAGMGGLFLSSSWSNRSKLSVRIALYFTFSCFTVVELNSYIIFNCCGSVSGTWKFGLQKSPNNSRAALSYAFAAVTSER